MTKTILTLALAATATAAMAQTDAQAIKIGHFSYNEVLKQLPDYTLAETAVSNLRKQYDDELKAAQKEFNEKYELFLEQQSTLAESIRRKRQADIQTLLERNEQFAKEAQRLLAQAEKEAMAPVHAKLKAAIAKAGEQQGYAIIVNTDSEACPFISPALATDATALILSLCK